METNDMKCHILFHISQNTITTRLRPVQNLSGTSTKKRKTKLHVKHLFGKFEKLN